MRRSGRVLRADRCRADPHGSAGVGGNQGADADIQGCEGERTASVRWPKHCEGRQCAERPMGVCRVRERGEECVRSPRRQGWLLQGAHGLL